MGAIDRRKHDIDVMERVLGGARDPLGESEPHTEVVDIGIHPWLAGSATSVVQVTVSETRQPHYVHAWGEAGLGEYRVRSGDMPHPGHQAVSEPLARRG